MKNLAWALLLMVSVLGISACTKDKETPKGVDGKPMLTKESNPERVVFETELDVPRDFRSKVKKTDLMIWDLKTEDGDVVAAQLIPVPNFPSKLVVTAKQLFTPISENSHLMFTARIVKFGDESKPPAKGQLQVMVGMNAGDAAVVENPAVNQKLMDKWMKKLKIVPAEELSVGSKVKAQFTPALM